MGRKENVLRAQYSLWLLLGTQYTHSHTHTHTHGVGPVQIRCRTNLVESDQEKKWDVGLIIYTTSLIAQCLALWIGTVKLSGAILAVEFDMDQGIYKVKLKVALNEKRKKLHRFSFWGVKKLSANLSFLKCVALPSTNTASWGWYFTLRFLST